MWSNKPWNIRLLYIDQLSDVDYFVFWRWAAIGSTDDFSSNQEVDTKDKG